MQCQFGLIDINTDKRFCNSCESAAARDGDDIKNSSDSLGDNIRDLDVLEIQLKFASSNI